MTKFCVKCGKELNENGACDVCNETKQEITMENGFVGLLKGFLEVVKGIITKPIDTLKSNCKEENFNISLVSIVAAGISMGIFLMIFMKEFGIAIISSLFGGYSSFLYGAIDIEIPYVKIFIGAFIGTAILLFAIASVAYLIINKILKKETSIKKMIILFGFSTIILSIGLLIASICLFISVPIAFIILMFAATLYNYYIFKGTEFVSLIDQNKLGYVMTITIVATTLILSFIGTKILG